MPTPAQAAIDRSRSGMTAKELRFPANLGDFFISLDFYDYRNFSDLVADGASKSQGGVAYEGTRTFANGSRTSVNAAIERGSFARIYLPIPSNLIDSNQVQWSAEQLGLLGGLLGEAWQSGTNMAGGVSLSPDGVLTGVLNAVDEVGGAFNNLGNNSTVSHAARRVAAMGMPLFGQLTDMGTGVAENPNLAVLFRGPTLKQHTFSWKLMPRSESESDTIRRIIATMKRAQAPERLNKTTTAFLKYPSEAAIAFHHPGESDSQWGDPKFLYQIRPCVIEDVIVNYAPHGAPAFLNDDHSSAVGIELQLKLQETSYNLRDSFDASSGEFGQDGYDTSQLRNISTGSDDDEDEIV